MAIITDATGRQLAQAVGGIDTGGLAKDTTLQATNTALGNINTTEQGIASAIAGLGQTLGKDKANIDGSNIVNPSAFRNAIGIDGALTGTTIKSGYIANHTSATIPLGSTNSAVGLIIIFRPDTGLYSVISFYGNSKQTILGTLPSTIIINTNTSTNSITINNSVGYTIPITVIANSYKAL